MEIIFPSTQYISIILGNQLIQHKSKVVRCRTKGESKREMDFRRAFRVFFTLYPERRRTKHSNSNVTDQRTLRL